MRTLTLAAAIVLAASCRPPGPTFDELLSSATLIDLSHSYDAESVYWPTEDGFQLESSFQGYTDKGYYYAANTFTSAEHGGTHLDAPIHFAEGRWSTEQVPLSSLIAPAVVIDVSDRTLANPDYRVTVDDLTRFEELHSRIPDGAIVLLSTGYSQFWPDRERYMGTDERGAEAVAKLHFPGLHPDAATWLAAERSIAAIGIDTPSIDAGQSLLFEAHQALFEANIPAFENVAGPERLPATGAWIFALPMKIAGGSGGPVRIVGVIPADA